MNSLVLFVSFFMRASVAAIISIAAVVSIAGNGTSSDAMLRLSRENLPDLTIEGLLDLRGNGGKKEISPNHQAKE